MANQILQNIISSECSKLVKEYGCQPERAFIRVLLERIYGLDDTEIDEAVVDGSLDAGIDAIFESETETGENNLYVIQSKYRQNFERSIGEDEKNKTINAIQQYILGDFSLKLVNAKVARKIQHIREGLSTGRIDRIVASFITNGSRPSINFYNQIDEYTQQNPTIIFEVYFEDQLGDYFLPVSAKKTGQAEIRMQKDFGGGEKSTLNLPDLDVATGRMARIDVYDIALLCKQEPNIFNINVRVFQTTKGSNNVNYAIKQTLLDEKLINQFIYLNNGITIVCRDFQIKPGGEVIILTEPYIINGCQTASTILEVFREGKLKPNLGSVLARIIKTTDADIQSRVILASNRQTAIKNRDLRSEDKIQKELEKEFEGLGYYYERKPKMHFDKPKDRVIDMEKAAQAYMALFLREPAEAKNKKGEIYKGNYDRIFSRDLTAKKLLVAILLYRNVDGKVKEIRKTASADDRSLYGNSTLHLLPLFDEWIFRPKGISLQDFEGNMGLTKDLIDSNLEAVLARLKKSVSAIKPDNYQYFFKNADSLNQILGTKAGKTDYELILSPQSYAEYDDLRYLKPNHYSVDGGNNFLEASHWSELFIELLKLFDVRQNLRQNIPSFHAPDSRPLFLDNPPEDEKKLRKYLPNSTTWVLTNFDSKTLARLCFDVANRIKVELVVKLRPTRFRIENRMKKRAKRRRRSRKS